MALNCVLISCPKRIDIHQSEFKFIPVLAAYVFYVSAYKETVLSATVYSLPTFWNLLN